MDWSKVVRRFAVGCLSAMSVSPSVLSAQSLEQRQSQASQQHVSASTAQSRLRPIGAPSAVDSFPSSTSSAWRPSAEQYLSSVRQVAMMQSAGDAQVMPPPSLGLPANPSLSPNPAVQPSAPGYSLPPSSSLPVPLQAAPLGPIASPPTSNPQGLSPRNTQSLPLNPNLGTTSPAPSVPGYSQPMTPVPQGRFASPGQPARSAVPLGSSDYAAIPAPQLENAFATIDNCRNISAPSTYRAAGVFGCGTPLTYGTPGYAAPAAYVPPPAQFAPAITLPPGATIAPVAIAGSLPPVIPGNPGYRPLISFGQEANPVQVGQGLLGQPVAYVPGQRFRNALRYISF